MPQALYFRKIEKANFYYYLLLQDSNSFYSYYFFRTVLEFTIAALLAFYMVFFGVKEIQTDAVRILSLKNSDLSNNFVSIFLKIK